MKRKKSSRSNYQRQPNALGTKKAVHASRLPAARPLTREQVRRAFEALKKGAPAKVRKAIKPILSERCLDALTHGNSEARAVVSAMCEIVPEKDYRCPDGRSHRTDKSGRRTARRAKPTAAVQRLPSKKTRARSTRLERAFERLKKSGERGLAAIRALQSCSNHTVTPRSVSAKRKQGNTSTHSKRRSTR